jgi:uncharacterized membrane protein
VTNSVTKLEFIATFRSACDGLPAELVETALADYERQFTDQFLSGVSEAHIVERWGSPQHAALKLKVGTFNGNLKESVSVKKVARVGLNGIGLALIDILLCVPAAVYCVVLAAFYIASIAMYLSGIFMSASSLAGVNYIDVPAHYLLRDLNFKGSTHLNFGNIEVVPTELVSDDDQDKPDDASPESNNPLADQPGMTEHTQHFLHDRGFHISTHISKGSAWQGVFTTLGGIILLVMCMLVTRISFLLLRQFVSWHVTVLRNA